MCFYTGRPSPTSFFPFLLLLILEINLTSSVNFVRVASKGQKGKTGLYINAHQMKS